MSFDINWDKIKDNYTKTIEDFLNKKFQSLQNLPKFLGPMTVTEFNLGTIPPNIVLKDMMEPFPYFYMGQAPWDNNGFEDEDETLDGNSQMDFSLDQANTLLNRHLLNTQLEVEMDVDSDLENELEDELNNLDLNRSHNINGGGHTSHNNTSYNNNPYSPTHLRSPGGNNFPHRPHDDLMSTNSTSHPHNQLPSKSDEDLQLLFSLEYDGNISFTISSSIQLSLPFGSFMHLPLKFKISGFQFNTNFLIIYLKQTQQVKFTLFDEILISNYYSSQFNLGSGDELLNWSTSVNLGKTNLNSQLLKNLKIESEIGDPNKQVLKNVDKVEKFILEQTRKIILNHFTYPKFFDFNLNKNKNNEGEGETNGNNNGEEGDIEDILDVDDSF